MIFSEIGKKLGISQDWARTLYFREEDRRRRRYSMSGEGLPCNRSIKELPECTGQGCYHADHGNCISYNKFADRTKLSTGYE